MRHKDWMEHMLVTISEIKWMYEQFITLKQGLDDFSCFGACQLVMAR